MWRGVRCAPVERIVGDLVAGTRRDALEFVVKRPGPEDDVAADESNLGVEAVVVEKDVQDDRWPHRAMDMAISPLSDEGFWSWFAVDWSHCSLILPCLTVERWWW